MYVAVCSLELFIPQAASRKDRRQVVKSLVERIRARTGASVAEVDGQETWQRTTLGVAMVSGEKAFLDKQVQQVRRLAEDQTEAELAWFTVEYY